MADLVLTIDKLNGFTKIARTQSQSEILKWFLRKIVLGKDRDGADLCQSGSVLVLRDGKLSLFNPGDFLFTEKFLDREKFKKTVFDTFEGMAGEAFSQQSVLYEPNVRDNKWFVDEGEPIKCMLCAPIILPSRPRRPFGVASFHNGGDGSEFSRDTRVAMELAVNILAFSLDLAARMPSNEVFIVHGHDKLALKSLQLILTERDLTPILLAEQPGRSKELLQEMEEQLANCCAGFVLLTPDDEGLLVGAPPAKPRARQNVIFEGGWLMGLFRQYDRVCFLKTDDKLELPSDLGGLKCEPFNPADPNEKRIEAILDSWGVSWRPLSGAGR